MYDPKGWFSGACILECQGQKIGLRKRFNGYKGRTSMSRLALIGNPNIGKTSLFNTLTNSYEYVGNWSGVTVEKSRTSKKLQKEIIDLPGVYTLNPISKDESVVTSFLLEDQVDGILNIIDASNFERNMQLTVDILELRKPVFICLNMIDVAKRKASQLMSRNYKIL